MQRVALSIAKLLFEEPKLHFRDERSARYWRCCLLRLPPVPSPASGSAHRPIIVGSSAPLWYRVAGRASSLKEARAASSVAMWIAPGPDRQNDTFARRGCEALPASAGLAKATRRRRRFRGGRN